jgi:hypothetical protein
MRGILAFGFAACIVGLIVGSIVHQLVLVKIEFWRE